MVGLLLGYRLRWYAVSTGRLLLRHWQSTVLTLGVLSPAATPFLLQLKTLATPILTIFSVEHSVLWRFSYLILLQTIGLLWAGVQRNNIAGGEFMNYAATLPLSPNQCRRADLGVLLLANGLLFVPIISAAIVLATLPLPLLEKTSRYLAMGVFTLLAVVAQLSLLERRYTQWLVILAIDFLLSASLTWPPHLAGWLLQALLLIIALVLVIKPSRPARSHPWAFPQNSFKAAQTIVSVWRATFPFAAIQIKAMLKDQMVATCTRLGITTGFTLGAVALFNIVQFDQRALPIAIIALAGIALVASGFFRALQSVHAPVMEYIKSLPISSRVWTRRDIIFVATLSGPFLCIIFYPLLIRGLISTLAACAVGISYMLLVAGLRLTQLYGGRQSVLLSAMLAALWATLIWTILI